MHNAASLGKACTVFPLYSTDICFSSEHLYDFNPHMQKCLFLPCRTDISLIVTYIAHCLPDSSLFQGRKVTLPVKGLPFTKTN